jgi:hypothetical protein
MPSKRYVKRKREKKTLYKYLLMSFIGIVLLISTGICYNIDSISGIGMFFLLVVYLIIGGEIIYKDISVEIKINKQKKRGER